MSHLYTQIYEHAYVINMHSNSGMMFNLKIIYNKADIHCENTYEKNIL